MRESFVSGVEADTSTAGLPSGKISLSFRHKSESPVPMLVLIQQREYFEVDAQMKKRE